MRKPILSATAMARAGWRRVDPRPWRKCSARWIHASGWRLEHCGHPTALHPWALFDPTGAMHCTGAVGDHRNPAYGTAWNSLATATSYVASVLR